MQEDRYDEALLIIIMGVSGSGKSTIAKLLADVFHFSFFEADDYHSEKNKKHMASGKPLSDEMREPWIQRLCDILCAAKKEKKHCVLAYSGLRSAHRQRFAQLGFKTVFIWLSGETQVITERMKHREHFMPASLLKSQMDALEAPLPGENVIEFDIDKPLNTLASEIKDYLSSYIRAC